MTEEINNLIKLIQNLPSDTAYHMLEGALLALLVLLFTSNTIVVIFISIAIGYGIEVFQEAIKIGTYNFIAVVVGSLLVTIPLLGGTNGRAKI